ncbi:uncharacterized protein LOC114077610 [Solanum pennellii]|uniref:Uncharacterized protein LOC114077610 n=1 Tax=Solanum pennellii TaxID=28526 RepID=A0ABM1VDA1_SOLPN|nr:uncharacterized protein LOC114077610 [Solanum pennellii]
MVQSHQKSYMDIKRRSLEFEVDGWVHQEVSRMKDVLRFELAVVYPVFHISMLKKCMGDPSLTVQIKNVGIEDSLSYEEIPLEILDQQVCKLRINEVASAKIIIPPRRAARGHPSRKNVEEQWVPNAAEVQTQGKLPMVISVRI